MDTLFKPDKDSRVADVIADPGFDTRPLIEHFGPDVTWRQVFISDKDELMTLPEYGKKTIDRIRKFLHENFDFTFTEFLED